MRINFGCSFKRTLLIGSFVICCLLPREASAVAIYDWIPIPTSGGTGFYTFEPLGAGATDSDFTSATIIDFTFTFDNGAPTITLSDLGPPGEDYSAVAGVLMDGFIFENPATFTDASLVFSAGSADYKNLDDLTPLPFPVEINGGQWLLRGTAPITDPIPEPSTLLLLGSGLVGLGFFRWRRKREVH